MKDLKLASSLVSLLPSTGSSSTVNKVDILLPNVPYITQKIANDNTLINNVPVAIRSKNYCGITAATTVRTKLSGTSSPLAYYSTFINKDNKEDERWDNINAVNTWLKTIDKYLTEGNYGVNFHSLDVAKYGLLYFKDSYTDEYQYNATVEILKGIYTGKFGNGDPDNIYDVSLPVKGVSTEPVKSISVEPVNAKIISGVTNGISEATRQIWDHIKDKKQPVVVVIDSNKRDDQGNINSTPATPPTLHFIVIIGIKEDSPGGTRYFFVYDPATANPNPLIKYKEKDLRYMIALPSNTIPVWVYKYGLSYLTGKGNSNPEPSYILKVFRD